MAFRSVIRIPKGTARIHSAIKLYIHENVISNLIFPENGKSGMKSADFEERAIEYGVELLSKNEFLYEKSEVSIGVVWGDLKRYDKRFTLFTYKESQEVYPTLKVYSFLNDLLKIDAVTEFPEGMLEILEFEKKVREKVKGKYFGYEPSSNERPQSLLRASYKNLEEFMLKEALSH